MADHAHHAEGEEHVTPEHVLRDYPQDVTLANFEERFLANIQRVFTEEDPFPEQRAYTFGNPTTLGPRIPDAATMAQRMVEGAQNNSGRWLQGVLNPRKDPKTEAIKANQKWKNGVTAAVQQNRFESGIRNYDEDAARATVQAIGTASYTAGIAARQSKIQRSMERLQPMLAALVRTLDAMPIDTPEQRTAKMVANLNGMRAIGTALKGGTAAR